MKKLHKRTITATVFSISVMIILMLVTTSLTAQIKKFYYNIIQGGSQAGTLILIKKDSGGIIQLQMESSVRKNLLFTITIYEKQITVIEKGQIKFSSVYRKVNGTIKTNKFTRLSSAGYIINKNGSTQLCSLKSLQHNQLSLYYEKPDSYHEIYSDQFEKMLPVAKLSDNNYKIELPDGNTNYYTYENGVLKNLTLKHFFFTAEFILTKVE